MWVPLGVKKKRCTDGVLEANVTCRRHHKLAKQKSWRVQERRRLEQALQELDEKKKRKIQKDQEHYRALRSKLLEGNSLQATTEVSLVLLNTKMSQSYEMSEFVTYAVYHMLHKKMIKLYEDPLQRYNAIAHDTDTKYVAGRYWTLRCVLQLTLFHYSGKQKPEPPRLLLTFTQSLP